MAEMSPESNDDKRPSRNTLEKNSSTQNTGNIKKSSVITKLDLTLTKLHFPIENYQLPQMSFEDIWNSKPHFRKTVTDNEQFLFKKQDYNYRKSIRERDEKITQLTKQLKAMQCADKNESVSVNIQISKFAKLSLDENVPAKILKQLDLSEYEPEEIKIVIENGYAIIHSKHEIDPVVLRTALSDQITVTICKRSHSSKFNLLKPHHQN